MNDSQTTMPQTAAAEATQPPARSREVDAPLWQQRLISAVLCSGMLLVLLLAAWMTPSPEGLGTHRSLGLPPCGMLQRTGIPCATCGMTTSFAHAADGNFVQSFITQPAGAILAILTAAGCLVTGYAAVFGMPILGLLSQLMRPRTVWTGLAILMIAWVYKILVTVG